jgi:hypothetical protein
MAYGGVAYELQAVLRCRLSPESDRAKRGLPLAGGNKLARTLWSGVVPCFMFLL